MDELEKNPTGSDHSETEKSLEGGHDISALYQMANRYYRENPSEPISPTQVPTGTSTAPGSSELHKMNTEQVSTMQAPASIQQATAVGPGDLPLADVQPLLSSMPSSELYFMQQPEAAEQLKGTEMLDLSGERCVLAPILPQILPPELAEDIIENAGRPLDRLKLMNDLANEAEAQLPVAGQNLPADGQHYFQDYGQDEVPVDDVTTEGSQSYYQAYFPDQELSQHGLYFQQMGSPEAANPPAEAEQPERKEESSAGTSDIDWSEYRMFHPESVRKDFPALNQTVNGQPLVWLDNAATTHKPWSVINTLSTFYERDNSNIHRGAHTLAARATDAYEEAREKVRVLLGAGSKEEILYVRGTTEGINLIANTFGRQRVGPGDEIILSELEHHANIVPWQMLAKEVGAHLRVIPINSDGDIMLTEYEELFNQRTRIVAISQVSNALGTVVPIEEMIATAHRHNVPVVVDGAQSVQHMPVNVQEMDADFFVFSGHKIFAPAGIGVVYGKQEHLEMMPPWQGGGNMIDRVSFEETTYNRVPAKFEAGTPSIGDAIGLGAAIDYVQKIGMENIHRYEIELMEYMVGSLSDIRGVHLIGNPKHRAGALSFVMDKYPVEAIGQLMDREGIALRAGHHCAQPALRHFGLEASARPSIAFYNTEGDIDRLRDALIKIS